MFKKRKIFISLIIFAICCTFIPITSRGAVKATKFMDVNVTVQGQKILFPQPPMMIRNNLFVPAGPLLKTLGLRIFWQTSTQFILYNDTIKIQLSLGKTTALNRDIATKLAAPPQTLNDTFYLPLRYVSESAEKSITWNPNTYTADIIPHANYQIIAYYPSWAAYNNDQITDIDANKLTAINYAFANIQNGKITAGDPWVDIEKPFPGECTMSGCKHGNFNQLNRLKSSHPRLQTIISVGGWSWSRNFSDVALTETSRRKFADSAVEFIRKWGFDGIDIDWEYPVGGGLKTNINRPQDKQNNTLLLKVLRNKLDIAGSADGKHYLLSIAAGASNEFIQNTQIAAIAKTVDWINLMAYDYNIPNDQNRSGFNAPLNFDPRNPIRTSDSNANAGVARFLQAGVPANKIVFGVPFYGVGWIGCNTNNNGLYQVCSGPSPGTTSAGVFAIADIEQNYLPNPNFIRYWDENSDEPWLFEAKTGLFISYDDAESISYKTAFIKQQNLAGAMIWEISSDHNHTLIDKLAHDLLFK